MHLFLTTERFALREIVEADRHSFMSCQRDPAFAQYHLEGERSPKHHAFVFDMFLQWQAQSPRKNYQFAISKLESPDCYLGTVGFRTDGLPVGQCELGIELVPSIWNNGAASEIMTAFVPWVAACYGVSVYLAETAPGNIAAERVLQSLGMQVVQEKNKRLWAMHTFVKRNLPKQGLANEISP